MPQLRDRWSWLDVVRYEDRLGIPHFQRGAVWETGNRTALLESIYEKLTDEQAHRRAELLEWVIIVLILGEIIFSVITFVRH